MSKSTCLCRKNHEKMVSPVCHLQEEMIALVL